VNPMPDRTKIFGTAAGIAVTAALSACSSSAGTPPSQPAPASVTGNDHSSSAPESKSDYADGQYSAEGRYGSLPSSIGVDRQLPGVGAGRDSSSALYTPNVTLGMSAKSVGGSQPSMILTFCSTS
jgi:hypothetical protein